MKKEPSTLKTKFTKIKKIFFLIVVVIPLILFGIYFYISHPLNSSSSSLSKNFIFKTSQNQEFHIDVSPNHIKIKEFYGKIIFLKVFGWNCQYCQKEIPELIQMRKNFKSAFNAIAIESQNHTAEENLLFVQKYHINYNIVEGAKQKDFLSYLKDVYKWDGVIPLTIVIDAKGKVLAFEVGYKSYSLTTLLQTTLKNITKTALPKE